MQSLKRAEHVAPTREPVRVSRRLLVSHTEDGVMPRRLIPRSESGPFGWCVNTGRSTHRRLPLRPRWLGRSG